MRKGLRRYSGFTAIAILMSGFSIAPASAAVTVDIKSGSTSITSGQGGSQTYVFTSSDASSFGATPTVQWWSSSAALSSAPTGLTLKAFTTSAGVADVVVEANGSQSAGTYYFKATLSGDISPLITLVVAVAPTITIGSASSSLTAGIAAAPTYGLTTSDLADGTSLTIYWVNSSATAAATPPAGINASVTTVSSNAATLTLNALNTSAAGTHYFIATYNSTLSNIVTLNVAVDTSPADTSPADTSPIDNSSAIAAAAAQAEIVRMQAIENSKKSLLQKIVENKTLTLSDLSSSGLQVSSTETAERVNVQIESLRAKNPDQVVTIEAVQLVVKKERLVERLLDSVSKQNVMSADLIEVGLIAQESKIKSSVTVALKKLPASSLDSFEKIQAAIASLEKIAADRKARLAAILDKLKR